MPIVHQACAQTKPQVAHHVLAECLHARRTATNELHPVAEVEREGAAGTVLLHLLVVSLHFLPLRSLQRPGGTARRKGPPDEGFLTA